MHFVPYKSLSLSLRQWIHKQINSRPMGILFLVVSHKFALNKLVKFIPKRHHYSIFLLMRNDIK